MSGRRWEDYGGEDKFYSGGKKKKRGKGEDWNLQETGTKDPVFGDWIAQKEFESVDRLKKMKQPGKEAAKLLFDDLETALGDGVDRQTVENQRLAKNRIKSLGVRLSDYVEEDLDMNTDTGRKEAKERENNLKRIIELDRIGARLDDDDRIVMRKIRIVPQDEVEEVVRNRMFDGEDKGVVATETLPKKEQEKNKDLLCYPGMIDDLRRLTRPDENMSTDELDERRRLVEKFERKGVTLPKMSTENPGSWAYKNRQDLQGAVEYLNPLYTGKYRREAIVFLKRLGIGRGGVEYLPGSAEAKENRENVELNENEKRLLVDNDLVKIARTGEGEEREQIVRRLEKDGIKITQLLEEVKTKRPEQYSDLKWLEAVVKWLKMDPVSKEKYPDLGKLALYTAEKLGM